MKIPRDPQDVHPPVAAYAHQIEIQGNERLLVLSGQIGMRPDGTVPEDPAEQLAEALENLARNLKAAQMDVPDLVKVTLYLVGEMDPARRREVLTAAFQGHKPCMTLVYVVSLANPALKVEVDAWASHTKN
jgi:enamine deaminase RidA (YjgF/YER057c/UK114 family)